MSGILEEIVIRIYRERWRRARGHFFFFFQAEDGIRDLTVTGVQTCALPIWFASITRYTPLIGLPPVISRLTGTSAASNARAGASSRMTPCASCRCRPGKRDRKSVV